MDVGISSFPGLVEILLLLAWAAIAVGATVFWIGMLIDCLVRETDDGSNRLIWTLVIVFTYWVGALIYYFVRRPQRLRQFGR